MRLINDMQGAPNNQSLWYYTINLETRQNHIHYITEDNDSKPLYMSYGSQLALCHKHLVQLEKVQSREGSRTILRVSCQEIVIGFYTEGLRKLGEKVRQLIMITCCRKEYSGCTTWQACWRRPRSDSRCRLWQNWCQGHL